jgi:hypothetical protein
MSDDKSSGMTFTKDDALAGMPDEIKDAPVGPMVGIAAIALNMALKYHDINTVQDGTLYQQYKLEGKNMHGLHLDMVFATAIQIEEHFVAANKRIAKLFVLAALEEGDEREKLESDAHTDETAASVGVSDATE